MQRVLRSVGRHVVDRVPLSRGWNQAGVDVDLVTTPLILMKCFGSTGICGQGVPVW